MGSEAGKKVKQAELAAHQNQANHEPSLRYFMHVGQLVRTHTKKA
jgi:hypothetical protein